MTTSPLSSKTMSPGTTCSAGIVFSFPSRRTREERVPSLRSASMERTARSSVKKPMSVLMASTSRIAVASVHSPKERCHGGRCRQQPHHWALDLLGENRHGGPLWLRQERVRAVTLEPQCRLRIAEAVSETYLLLLQHRRRRQRIGKVG